MTEPGWYHATGDPEGTKRYWDGAAWVGEPTGQTGVGDVIYYAAAETQVDLGDVATRISLKETDPTTNYAQSPYSVSTASVNVLRRKPLPEGLKNLTILVCVLKAIPMFSVAAGIVAAFGRSTLNATGSRFDPPGLNYGTSGTKLIVITLFVLFAALTFSQGRAALKDQASSLFVLALIMLTLDVLNAINQWAKVAQGLSAGASMLATVILVLQVLVTVGAGVQASRS